MDTPCEAGQTHSVSSVSLQMSHLTDQETCKHQQKMFTPYFLCLTLSLVMTQRVTVGISLKSLNVAGIVERCHGI